MASHSESGVGKLFIRNLDNTVDHKTLYDIFSPYGNILSCKVVNDKGYGFVDFATSEAANMAIEKVSGTMLNGKKVFVKRNISREELENDFGKVFVSNLDKATDNKTLYDLLSPYGKILSCDVIVDETGQCKGFGFVRFETEEAAVKAVKEGPGIQTGRYIEVRHSIHDFSERKIHRSNEISDGIFDGSMFKDIDDIVPNLLYLLKNINVFDEECEDG